MSFSRPPIPSFGDNFDTQSLARYESQISINSTTSRMSVKSAFTKSPTKLFQKVSFQVNYSSFYNILSIFKTLHMFYSVTLVYIVIH